MVGTLALADLGILFNDPAGAEAELTGAATAESGDAALIRAALRGDRDAFGRLVDGHKRMVFGLCLRLLRDHEESHDAAQETFIRAYAALAGFEPTHPFAPWLLRIARNHCIDVLRRRLPAHQRVDLDAPPRDESGPERELTDTSAIRGDDALERRQTAQTLSKAVAALPENYREVVTLFHVEQLSYKDIASAMDVPIGTVMTWLHRARAQLKKSLAEREEVLP